MGGKALVANAQDIDDAVSKWTQIFVLILEKHAPTLRRRVSDRNTPWLNADYFKLTKTRDKLKTRAVKSNSKLLMGAYKQIRNRLNNLNTQLKREYFSEQITQFQGDLKKTWKTINQVISKKSNTTIVPNLTVDGQTIRSNKAIASSMNEYFAALGTNLVRKFQKKAKPLLSGEYLFETPLLSFFFCMVSRWY